MSIETAVLVLCHKPECSRELENWFITRIEGKVKRGNNSRKETKFLIDDMEWKTFLPLLLLYVSTFGEGNKIHPTFINCVKHAFL